MTESRFSRNELLFGREGQKRIEATRVAIVGAGGLGAHVVQQLAYLGVKTLSIIDGDKVSLSNLNRLVGATEHDVGTTKVRVLERLIKAVRPEARVVVVNESFITEEGFSALKGSDFIFGCVDKDGARLVLTEFAAAYSKPYLDVATDAGNDGQSWGGRMVFMLPDGSCLYCRRELAQEEVRRDLFTPGELRVEERIYGVSREALGNTGPSVVSLNGILASVAVTEFMALVTGLRKPRTYLQYHGVFGILTTPSDPPMDDCYYCRTLYGKGEAADVERYIRQGVGKYT